MVGIGSGGKAGLALPETNIFAPIRRKAATRGAADRFPMLIMRA